MYTAARTSVLAAFTAGQGYCADADYSPRAWLINRTQVTKGAAVGYTAWVRRAAAHPGVAAVLAAGEMSESYARTICAWTGKLPEDSREDADEILLTAAGNGMGLRDLAGLAGEIYARSLPANPGSGEDEAFGDRSVRLETTFGGAGVLHGDLTPECASVVATVLDALSAPAGAEDTRSQAQRFHDGLQEAMRPLCFCIMMDLMDDTQADRAEAQLRAGVYARLSETYDAAESVPTQLERGTDHARRRGWAVTATFKDDGFSGFKEITRDGFGELIAAIEAGAVDVVIVRDIDRLTRNLTDWNAFEKVCVRHGVRLSAYTGGDLDLSTAEGAYYGGMETLRARRESAVKSARVREAQDREARKGRRLSGGQRWFGYTRIYANPGRAESEEAAHRAGGHQPGRGGRDPGRGHAGAGARGIGRRRSRGTGPRGASSRSRRSSGGRRRLSAR